MSPNTLCGIENSGRAPCFFSLSTKKQSGIRKSWCRSFFIDCFIRKILGGGKPGDFAGLPPCFDPHASFSIRLPKMRRMSKRTVRINIGLNDLKSESNGVKNLYDLTAFFRISFTKLPQNQSINFSLIVFGKSGQIPSPNRIPADCTTKTDPCSPRKTAMQ